MFFVCRCCCFGERGAQGREREGQKALTKLRISFRVTPKMRRQIISVLEIGDCQEVKQQQQQQQTDCTQSTGGWCRTSEQVVGGAGGEK